MDIYTLIGIIVSVVGGIPGVFFLTVGYRKRNKNWRMVIKYIQNIADQISESQFKPDLFLAFPKGGLIVADLLGHLFSNDIDIAVLHTKRTIDHERNEVIYHIRHPYTNFENMKDKNVLIIDDVLENGVTIKEIIHLLEKMDIKRQNIKVAVLGRSIGVHPAINPNYHAFDYVQSKGLTLPWGKVTL